MSPSLQKLSREECLSLLASVPLGRVAVTVGALPIVLPVNFVLDDGAVVIRTAATSTLATAARDAIVAFQADDVDRATRSGWSVSVTGPAHVVESDVEIARLRRLPLRPWAPGVRDTWIRVQPVLVEGRRLWPHPALVASQATSALNEAAPAT